MRPTAITLGEIAQRFNLTLRGNGDREVVGVCSLAAGAPNRLGYISDASHQGALAQTTAGAVIVNSNLAAACPEGTAALIAEQPKLAYIKVAALFLPAAPAAGIHASAIISEHAQVDPSASVGPQVVVATGAVIAANVVLAAGCVIDEYAQIGELSVIGANASIGREVTLGQRVHVGPNAVLGGRGFGLEHDGKGWQAIPQLGSVSVGDDVEIGAGSTIDRGAIDDTCIGNGVKIDDQVHIAHNCRIGAHTVIAGCTGIAGSCTIGQMCVIGGGVGIGDHVTIVDNVMITGATQVPADILEAGVYSSTLRAMPAGQWRKRLAHLRKIDRIADGLRELQRQLKK